MEKFSVIKCKDGDDLAAHAAAIVLKAAQDSVHERDRFMIALAGGSTPEKTYKLLTQQKEYDAALWSKTFAFFGDERMVPTEDKNSNYGMAKHALLNTVPLPPDQVFPVDVSSSKAEEAAVAYAKTMSDVFNGPDSADVPVFDLILLGMGDDGHTASLFPHAAALNITDTWAVGSPPGTLPPPVDRVTLTYPVLNAARQVVFLVSGEKKADALKDVLENQPDPLDRPAAGVEPDSGFVTWLVDEAAAQKLTHVKTN